MYTYLRPREDTMLNPLSTPRLVGAISPRSEETMSTPLHYYDKTRFKLICLPAQVSDVHLVLKA